MGTSRFDSRDGRRPPYLGRKYRNVNHWPEYCTEYKEVGAIGATDERGYDFKTGFNIWGIDANGFDSSGYYHPAGDLRNPLRGDRSILEGASRYDYKGYDRDGYDRGGRDKSGRNREGYDARGFNTCGVHRNGTQFDEKGFDFSGFDIQGYDNQGYDRQGFDRQGFDRAGFDVNGKNRWGMERHER